MIWQTTVWTCDHCGYEVSLKEKVDPFSDPTVEPPDHKEWDYVGDVPGEELHVCSECAVRKKLSGTL